ncbi:PTS sugar transporter subunit IIC [Lacrimispora sp.]|uniref:PTS sugar transporter subunit IIC n=1 Tax=Lacrimispora sp. TaxID=2719234 RepID=UPI0028A67514|nr:PTS transporter subunit EIIC [Lacrimispora sp.]
MNKFNSVMESHFLPLADKLNSVKGIIAVRDAFLQIFPLTLIGSIVTMINVVIFNSTGFIGQFLMKIWPNLNSAQGFLSPVLTGTITIMSLFATFLIARNISELYDGDGIKAGMTSLAAFFILYIPPAEGKFISDYFGANGIFVAIFIGLLVGYLFSKLSAIEALKIKMPETVPPEVLKSFMVVMPMAIILTTTSIIAYLTSFIEPNGINALIYSSLQAPIQQLGTNPFTPMILITMAMIFWIFGIHGTATVSPIYLSIYMSMNISNIAHAAQAGTTVGSPYPYTWFVLFENYGCIGGTGNTLALIVAILLLSKNKNKWVRDDYTKIAKLALIPGLFCINEPIIFGLPIVLNPILAIPFMLSPIISMGLGALMISAGLVPPGTLDVGWTTPQPFKAFLSASGSWQTALSVCIVFVICVVIYLPFVKMANNNGIKNK